MCSMALYIGIFSIPAIFKASIFIVFSKSIR